MTKTTTTTTAKRFCTMIIARVGLKAVTYCARPAVAGSHLCAEHKAMLRTAKRDARGEV
jgi:hypothetical protein